MRGESRLYNIGAFIQNESPLFGRNGLCSSSEEGHRYSGVVLDRGSGFFQKMSFLVVLTFLTNNGAANSISRLPEDSVLP